MSEAFLGEIRIMSFNFAPRGYALCNGQTLAIAQNQALFSLLGTTYGGNGVTTFVLPNLQGATPVHPGNVVSLGQKGGENSHTLSIEELPQHTHTAQASTAAGAATPAGSFWGGLASGTALPYSSGSPNVSMQPANVSTVGGGQPHNNQQPYLVINFVIALVGFFPSRN